ncbi:MAG: sigma-E factor regulatory protein RseB domain-containing protein, partial [Wenzhouxiangellaceae bacterium]
MRRCSGIMLLLLAGPLAAGSAEQWLERMDDALATISYRGTLVSISNNRVDTLRVIHRVDQHGVRERIHALDGIPREVLRDGDSVRCLIDGQSSVVVDNPFPRRLLARIPPREMFGENAVYRLHEVGAGRVAGRDARIIEIAPLDDYRYGRRLWLDQATGLPLRSQIYDHQGNAVEKLSFVEIEMNVEIGDYELTSELTSALTDKAQPVHYGIG